MKYQIEQWIVKSNVGLRSFSFASVQATLSLRIYGPLQPLGWFCKGSNWNITCVWLTVMTMTILRNLFQRKSQNKVDRLSRTTPATFVDILVAHLWCLIPNSTQTNIDNLTQSRYGKTAAKKKISFRSSVLMRKESDKEKLGGEIKNTWTKKESASSSRSQAHLDIK